MCILFLCLHEFCSVGKHSGVPDVVPAVPTSPPPEDDPEPEPAPELPPKPGLF